MASNDSGTDLATVPLIALNMAVRKKLGLYLNPRNPVAADWMAVAEAMGFTYLEIKNYETCKSPTVMVLENWQARCTDATVGQLLSILEKVERTDVVEDLRSLIGARKSESFFSHLYVLRTNKLIHIRSAYNMLYE